METASVQFSSVLYLNMYLPILITIAISPTKQFHFKITAETENCYR